MVCCLIQDFFHWSEADQYITFQVAKAVEYLHRQHIIYRDLKSENILVWDMPPPFIDHPDYSVHIKVADYGTEQHLVYLGSTNLVFYLRHKPSYAAIWDQRLWRHRRFYGPRNNEIQWRRGVYRKS